MRISNSGHYHVGFLRFIGVQNAHRIDLLPFFIQFRMTTDVVRDVHHHVGNNAPAQGPTLVQQAFNWFLFSLELVCVAGLLAGAGWQSVSRAYCEACRRWMTAETLNLPPGLGATIWDHLQGGDYATAQRGLAAASGTNAVHGTITIEHCPSCPERHESSAVYLTVKDFQLLGTPEFPTPKFGRFFKFNRAGTPRSIVNQVELNPEEVGAFVKRVPKLTHTVDQHPSVFVEARSAADEIVAEAAAAVADMGRTTRIARIEDVAPDEAGTVLTRGNAILQAIVGIGSGLGGLVLALAPVGVILGLNPNPPAWVSAVALFWMFGVLALSLAWSLFFVYYPTSRLRLRQTRRAFEFRPNPAVDLNDPDLVFVDVVPRANWGKMMMMETASDIGFLQLDQKRRSLIFEGDRQRYWIPAESILEIKLEFWVENVQHQYQTAATLHHLVVVRALTADGPWETWFSRRQITLERNTAKRRLADAQELENKIRQLAELAPRPDGGAETGT